MIGEGHPKVFIFFNFTSYLAVYTLKRKHKEKKISDEGDYPLNMIPGKKQRVRNKVLGEDCREH